MQVYLYCLTFFSKIWFINVFTCVKVITQTASECGCEKIWIWSFWGISTILRIPFLSVFGNDLDPTKRYKFGRNVGWKRITDSCWRGSIVPLDNCPRGQLSRATHVQGDKCLGTNITQLQFLPMSVLPWLFINYITKQ